MLLSNESDGRLWKSVCDRYSVEVRIFLLGVQKEAITYFVFVITQKRWTAQKSQNFTESCQEYLKYTLKISVRNWTVCRRTAVSLNSWNFLIFACKNIYHILSWWQPFHFRSEQSCASFNQKTRKTFFRDLNPNFMNSQEWPPTFESTWLLHLECNQNPWLPW